MESTLYRNHLADLVLGRGAHISFERAIEGFPFDRAGERSGSIEHSMWMLVNHIRICQDDILEFTVDSPTYKELPFPSGYWPDAPEPPDRDAWENEIDAVRAGVERAAALAQDQTVDLFSELPHAPGYTVARELTLIVAHNGYHIGQMVDLRMALGVPVRDY